MTTKMPRNKLAKRPRHTLIHTYVYTHKHRHTHNNAIEEYRRKHK